ncbi:MAG TPA: hypothetical protein VKC66_24700 [Xanthobacteraceae bacterium]|nr:hypothetical protein [Xanthobacteraceae bacterium]
MNAFAFAAQTVNLRMMAVAVALGISIPALVYALTRVRRSREGCIMATEHMSQAELDA